LDEKKELPVTFGEEFHLQTTVVFLFVMAEE
jgi:hypothetical protein